MKPLLLIPALACLALFTSCSTMDDAMDDGASLAAPDRDKEGFSGPGVRMDDDIPKSDINEVDIHRRGAPSNKNQGVDFFQFKKKF